MKVWITADGMLNICPQNELEQYALGKWCEEWRGESADGPTIRSDNILIHDSETKSPTTNERGI